MKKILSVLSFLIMGITLIACSSEETEGGTTPTISTSTLTFPCEGGSQNVTINDATVDKVTLPANSDWYSINKVANGTTSTYLRITAEANTAYDPRTATLTIGADKTNLNLTLTQEATPAPPETTDAFKMGQSNGMGWNLGNNMDAVDTWSTAGEVVAKETAWGNKAATAQTFKTLAAEGIKIVRIPVTWQGHVGAAPDYTIDDEWMGRVAELVGYAKDAGLKCIINIHHDEGAGEDHWGFLDIKTAAYDATKNAAVEAQLKAMWTQIATKFKNEGDYLIFESMNEVQDGGWGWTTGDHGNLGDGGKQYATLNEWQQVFVSAVRAVGGENTNRWLAVVGYAQDPSLTINNLVLPTDPTSNRLMVAVHCYSSFDYSCNATCDEWGHTSSVSSTKNGEAELRSTVENLKAAYVDKNIPVYIGEMGSVNRESESARKFQKYYMEYYARCCYLNGVTCLVWDNAATTYGKESFGYCDHATGEYIGYAGEIIPKMVNAVSSTDATYTLESIYATAP